MCCFTRTCKLTSRHDEANGSFFRDNANTPKFNGYFLRCPCRDWNFIFINVWLVIAVPNTAFFFQFFQTKVTKHTAELYPCSPWYNWISELRTLALECGLTLKIASVLNRSYFCRSDYNRSYALSLIQRTDYWANIYVCSFVYGQIPYAKIQRYPHIPYECIWRSGGAVPLMFNLVARRRWGRFNLRKRAHSTHWIGN